MGYTHLAAKSATRATGISGIQHCKGAELNLPCWTGPQPRPDQMI